jgi:hypothetical protein
MAGCELGKAPVTYELVDVDDANFPIGPTGMATGDIDGDADVDVVVTGRHSIGVLTNDGTGAFTLDAQGFADDTDASLADVDGDGDLDLVSAVPASVSSFPRQPALRRNDGNGTFGPIELLEPTTPLGTLIRLITSDVDGDGDVDLLSSLTIDNDRFVATYLNDGTGAFGAPTASALGFTSDTATPVELVAGDLDGDGDDDVVATDVARIETPDGDTVERTFAMVGLNDGTGSFASAGAPIDAGFAGTVFGLVPTLGDLDGDGHLDLALGGPSRVTILPGDGAGGFGPSQFGTITGSRDVDLVTPADIDGDGRLDLVGFADVLDPRKGVVAYGDGAGGIDEGITVTSGTRLGGDGTPARDVETPDIDGDGDPDVLFLAGSLGVLENVDGGR